MYFSSVLPNDTNMNEQLVKFIELCLVDGVISDKEREVIFRKSKELGVPDDECEILIDSLVSKHSKKSNQPDTPKKKGGFFSSMFNEIKNNIDTESIKSSWNQVKDDFQKGMDISKGRSISTPNPQKVQTTKTNSKELEEKDLLPKENKKQERHQNGKESKQISYQIKYTQDDKHSIYKEYLEVIGSKKIHTELGITNGKRDYEYYSEIFEGSDYNKIVEVIKSQYSDKIGCYNKEECIQIMNRRPGFFETPSIWSMISGDLKYDLEEINLGIGNDSECIIFLDRYLKLYSRGSYNEYLKGGIHCGRDGGWIWTENLGDSIKFYQFGLHAGEDGKTFTLTPQIKEIINQFIDLRVDQIITKIKIKKSKTNRLNDERITRNNKVKKELISEFDKDQNGVIDLFQGDDEFMVLFRKNQEVIQTKGDDYVKNFVKVSTYLNTKRDNINKIYKEIINHKVDSSYGIKKSTYDELKEVLTDDEIENLSDFNLDDINGFENSVGLFRNQIHLWNLVFLHSTNMIVSLIEDDKITFYEIYEKLDKLNIFNSNWENEVSERLKNIEDGLGVLIYSINKMESNIISELQNMTYLTNESLKKLNESVSKSLNEVNRQLSVQTMWSIVNTYQVYKINKNTKSLRD